MAKRVVASETIDADTIFPKSIFAFFGHTQRYSELVDKFPDDAERRNQQRSVFQDDFREICRLAHAAIVQNQFDVEKHPWILDPDALGSPFPRKFTSIGNQLLRDAPSIDDRKSKVFPKAYAAICSVVRDILKYPEQAVGPNAKKILQLCDLNEDLAAPSKQTQVLFQISKSLRLRQRSIVPNWPVTYEGKRPTMKVDDPQFFLHPTEVARKMEELRGKYFIYRRAFNPPTLSTPYIREHLTIYDTDAGPVFKWTTVVGEDSMQRTFIGPVVLQKKSLWFIGNDDQPVQRLWLGTINLEAIYRYRKFETETHEGPFGIVLSSIPNEVEPNPGARTFLLKSVVSGETKEDDFGNGARFISSSQLLGSVSDDSVIKIDRGKITL